MLNQLDKLLIIFILIIIILLIIINFNNKYEKLEEINNNNNNNYTTYDALNNITKMISNNNISSKNLDITNNANIDKINVKDLNVSNSLINKGFINFYDNKASIIIVEISNPPVELKIDNVEVFGIISKDNKSAILYSNYFVVENKHKKWLGIKEIILNSYNIILKPKNEFGIKGNVIKYTYQSDSLNYGNNDVSLTSDYEYPDRFLLIKMKLKYLDYIVYYITQEYVASLNWDLRKYYLKLETVSFDVEEK